MGSLRIVTVLASIGLTLSPLAYSLQSTNTPKPAVAHKKADPQKAQTDDPDLKISPDVKSLLLAANNRHSTYDDIHGYVVQARPLLKTSADRKVLEDYETALEILGDLEKRNEKLDKDKKDFDELKPRMDSCDQQPMLVKFDICKTWPETKKSLEDDFRSRQAKIDEDGHTAGALLLSVRKRIGVEE